ncbi:MAG TPA: choice-of-anchor V domain-containing protein [Bryobacteraceae bacterium]|nr:choice-of-anchor V domain-containing protein [Bryobacteraceae bacterium]
MKLKRNVARGVSCTFLAIVPPLIFAYYYGPDPRSTGAPGDAALACAQSGCHTGLPKGGPINNYPGFGVTATFSSGSTYTPGGGPITITVAVTDPSNKHYGFQMTARLESNLTDGQAGDFNTAGSNELVICEDNSSKGPKGCPSSAPVEFIEHDYESYLQVGTSPYTFTWTPPATNVGNVHFYVAGNAVNLNNAADSGDHVYTASYTLTPGASGSGGTPTISQNGVVSASQFGAFATVAPGSWMEIYGSNLSSSTRGWSGSDFNGNNAPTSLDGVKVTINGQAAFVDYISPGQVNAQVPSNVGTGPVVLTVSNANGTSAPYNITVNTTQPGLLAPPSFTVGGKQYVGALLPDGSTYILPSGAIAGVNSRPAKPGETIILYGIGFGAVNPNIPAGQIVTQSNQIAAPLQILFGQTPATLSYFGLAPNFVGLYQFNVVVPSIANSNTVPLTFNLGGVAGTQTLVTAVHN